MKQTDSIPSGPKIPASLKLSRILATALVLISLFPTCASAVIRNVVAINETHIQRAINALPAAGGVLVIYPYAGKPVLIRKPIVIDRDDVTLRGESGVVLQLADGALCPVVVFGSAGTPTVVRRNIHLSNFIIDGNRTKQTSEFNTANHELRNNGVTLRKVIDSSVRNVTIRSCRSGGLVAELGCRRLTISDVDSSDNFYDGIAGYQTEESLFKAIKSHANLSAGFSFDIAFKNNILTDGLITGNGKVGIFMRDSRDNVFANFQIRSNQQDGIFLAQVDADTTKPALGNTFHGCVVSNSGGAGIRLNDASCTANLLGSSQLVSNAGGGIMEVANGQLTVSAVIVR